MITNDAQKYLVCAGGDGLLTTIDLKGRLAFLLFLKLFCIYRDPYKLHSFSVPVKLKKNKVKLNVQTLNFIQFYL